MKSNFKNFITGVGSLFNFFDPHYVTHRPLYRPHASDEEVLNALGNSPLLRRLYHPHASDEKMIEDSPLLGRLYHPHAADEKMVEDSPLLERLYHPHASDQQALAADWKTVGKDFWHAVEIYEKEKSSK